MKSNYEAVPSQGHTPDVVSEINRSKIAVYDLMLKKGYLLQEIQSIDKKINELNKIIQSKS